MKRLEAEQKKLIPKCHRMIDKINEVGETYVQGFPKKHLFLNHDILMSDTKGKMVEEVTNQVCKLCSV